MTKYVELRRHTDNDDDALSADGIRQALKIGARLAGNYEQGDGVLVVEEGGRHRVEPLG